MTAIFWEDLSGTGCREDIAARLKASSDNLNADRKLPFIMRKPSIRLGATILAAASLLICPHPAFTAPTFGFNAAGLATLNIDDFTVETYASNLTIENVGSATKNGGTYTFPIVGGAVDAGTVVLEAIMTGGMRFNNGADVVTLDEPIVNTTASPAIMTFLVTVNGNLQGRYAIFNLKAPNYAKPQSLAAGKAFKAPNISVSLSPAGANLFNNSLGTHFAAGVGRRDGEGEGDRWREAARLRAEESRVAALPGEAWLDTRAVPGYKQSPPTPVRRTAAATFSAFRHAYFRSHPH